MNESYDDELQAWLDAQFPTEQKPPVWEADDNAMGLYRQLYEELAVKPSVGLSYGFSENVVRQIVKKETAQRERKAYAVFGFCLLLMPLVALAMQVVFRREDLPETVRALDTIKFPVMYVLLLLGLIQWSDRRFVKPKLNP